MLGIRCRHVSIIVAVAQIVALSGCNEPGQVDVARGNALASRGDFEGALQAYESAAKAAPKRARPHELIGHVLFDRHRFDEAEKAYRQAIDVEPATALEARIGLARIEAERGKLDSSIEQLNAILTQQPRNLYALLSRANLLIRRSRPGDVEQAILDTANAMPIDAKNSAVLYTRGNAFLAAGQLDKAEEVFGLLAAAHPQSPLSAYGDARVSSARKNRSAVLERLREAKAKAGSGVGGWNPNEVRADSAFQWLKDDPQFVSLVTGS